jgi:hypothetical protein
MAEHRRLKRRQLLFYPEVLDANTSKPLGRLGDITAEGAMLMTEQPIEKGEIVCMRVVLPFEALGKNHVDLFAQCAWCKRQGSSKNYTCGLQLSDAVARDVETITAFIVEQSFPE